VKYILKIVAKARLELLEAKTWYEAQQLGSGDRFINEFFNKAEFVQNNPQHYPLKNEFREARIHDFPFLIIYRMAKKGNIIYVTSVFHTSRHPKRKLK